MDSTLPTIAISSGDPAGIGPEIVAKALADDAIRDLARWIVVGEASILASASASSPFCADGAFTENVQLPTPPCVVMMNAGALSAATLQPGVMAAEFGLAALKYVELATQLCQRGIAAAMVTAPLSKEAVALSGKHFTGHTEYIAELCGCSESRMLLVNDRLRVVHVTTHCGLAEAARVEETRVFRTITLGHEAMLRLGWQQPRIAVCGINPHAGENGMFGDQESRVIAPAIAKARERGIDCSGPYPADTLFLQAVRGKYDMVVAMYHDQGHVPMKLLDFEHTVNVSLGLPIVRTSVDHGTAFDIAGKDVADASDMKTALRFAVQMVEQRVPIASPLTTEEGPQS